MPRNFFYMVTLCFTMIISPILISEAASEEIKIGLMCPKTGKWASEGHDMERIVTLLVEKYNRSGELGDKKIELIVADDGGDPRTAALAAHKLISEGVVAIIGTYGSAVTEATQNIIADANVLHIGTGSTSIRLTEKGLPLFFRTCPRDDQQGIVAAKTIEAGSFKKIAIVHDNSSYAKGLAEETRKNLDNAGIEVVYYNALTPGQRDYTAILTKLKSVKPDLIFYTGYYPEVGMLLRQKKEMKWDVPMMGGDAANHADLVKISGVDAAQGYFFVSPPLPQDLKTPEAKLFIQEFKQKYETEPVSVWAILAGDALNVVAVAIKNNKLSSEQMAEFFKGSSEPFEGILGEVAFDSKGDRTSELYQTYIVDATGKFILQSNP